MRYLVIISLLFAFASCGKDEKLTTTTTSTSSSTSTSAIPSVSASCGGSSCI